MINYQNATFIKSAAAPSGFISDGLPQVVFAGKSNVGKSSVINKLLNRKNFARVGATPGKTVHVNYFQIDGRLYFVDLPGYGYAKVPMEEKKRWSQLMESFFARPELISLGILIVDARHQPTPDDVLMSKWFLGTDCRMVVVANKSDKLNATEREKCVGIIRETLAVPEEIPVILFSAEKGTNREALLKEIVNISKR
jgi:GTP-binding protein